MVPQKSNTGSRETRESSLNATPPPPKQVSPPVCYGIAHKHEVQWKNSEFSEEECSDKGEEEIDHLQRFTALEVRAEDVPHLHTHNNNNTCAQE